MRHRFECRQHTRGNQLYEISKLHLRETYYTGKTSRDPKLTLGEPRIQYFQTMRECHRSVSSECDLRNKGYLILMHYHQNLYTFLKYQTN